jgi:hypothetical protein
MNEDWQLGSSSGFVGLEILVDFSARSSWLRDAVRLMPFLLPLARIPDISTGKGHTSSPMQADKDAERFLDGFPLDFL